MAAIGVNNLPSRLLVDGTEIGGSTNRYNLSCKNPDLQPPARCPGWNLHFLFHTFEKVEKNLVSLLCPESTFPFGSLNSNERLSYLVSIVLIMEAIILEIVTNFITIYFLHCK